MTSTQASCHWRTTISHSHRLPVIVSIVCHVTAVTCRLLSLPTTNEGYYYKIERAPMQSHSSRQFEIRICNNTQRHSTTHLQKVSYDQHSGTPVRSSSLRARHWRWNSKHPRTCCCVRRQGRPGSCVRLVLLGNISMAYIYGHISVIIGSRDAYRTSKQSINIFTI